MSRRFPQRLAALTRAWMTPVVALGVAGVFLVSVPSVRAALDPALDGLLAACLVFFAVDWLLGLWQARVAKRLAAWLTSLEHAVDALAVWPILIAATAGIDSPTVWFPGILWLLELGPARTSIAMLGRVAATEARPLISVAVLFFVVLQFAAVAIHVVERDVQPGSFGSLPASLYWAITTLTTTGYGDLVPITPVGRMLAGFVMIAGIAVFGLWIGVLATAFAQESRRIDFVRTWEIVADSPFFKSLNPSEIIEIANMLRRWDVPAGTTVIREGQEGDCMYFIASGQADVEVADRTIQLTPPAFFGELALLGSGVRTATVTTTSPAILLVLDRTDFRLFLARHPVLAETIRGEAVRRAEQNLETSPAG
ncbi:MAG: cyclic nucleotide-binding domain-containing protein [Rhodoplanes sp.]|uniref:cyclic nucleotide-gated ion channel n=1 Tax=Rhodoplanes sp. TaxID=1968906 RepID=UPI0017B4DA36|nr:cyclic nucleotide-gated ion channel [Rhodoplanes sp.]NVO17804.1 cyclic nucleotide-binding domain-containing protein [Rhodoplanes sp.]